MQNSTDNELLRLYSRDGSEEAFAEIVRRHIGLVHSVAARHTSDPQQAQDITQAVFIILARKAGSLGRSCVLGGWLYHTARLTAANAQRAEYRRIRREQEAYMESTMDPPAPDTAWRDLRPRLDDAMGRLGETDRNAVVLRFFENRTLQQVGAALGLRERAAQKRVQRALDKLRKLLSRRGVTLPAALLTSVLTADAVQAAPSGLATSVTAAAANGSTISAPLTTLVKGTMKTMTWLKVRYTLGSTLATLLAGGLVATVALQAADSNSITAREIATQSLAAYAALSSYSDEGTLETGVGNTQIQSSFSIRMSRPERYRVEWTPGGQGGPSPGVVWSAGEGHFLRTDQRTEEEPTLQAAVTRASMLSQNVAGTVPGAFFNLQWGNTLGAVAMAPQRLSDERVDRESCHVLTTTMGGVTPTLWISKKDHLIRQVRYVFSGEPIQLPNLTDDQIRELLTSTGEPATDERIAQFRTGVTSANAAIQQAMGGLQTQFVGQITEKHSRIRTNLNLRLEDFTAG